MNASVPSLQHLQAHREDLVALCRRRHVRRLDLSGSTARGEARAGSDYDFLVEFEPLPPGGYATAYFGLMEDLQALLGAPVELIVERAIRNPYFRQSLDARREALYAA
jgi:predicted nucleotidyltransferase